MITRRMLVQSSAALLALTSSLFAAPEQTQLKLHFQNSNHFIPIAVAKSKGWFTEAGFENVELTSFSSGALAGEALLAGEISVWLPGNLPVISMRHNALPVVVVGKICDVYEKLVVRTDAGIETPEDLYDKRIGLLEGSTASAMLHNIATQYGLDESRLTSVNLPPPEQISALANNDVQAVIVWEPVATRARQAAEGEFLVQDNISGFEGDAGTEILASKTLVPIVFSEPFMRENPETARAVLQTLVKAVEYTQADENREEVISIFSEASGREPADIEREWDEYHFDVTIDQDYVDAMQNYTDYLDLAGRISRPKGPLTYTSTEFLAEMNPDYVETPGEWK